MEQNMQDKLIKLSQAESQVISLYHDLNGAILGEMRKTLDNIKDEDFDQRAGFEYAQKLKKLQMDQSTLFNNVSMFLDSLGRDLDQSSYLTFAEDNFDGNEDFNLPADTDNVIEDDEAPIADLSDDVDSVPFEAEDEAWAPDEMSDDEPEFDDSSSDDDSSNDDLDQLLGDDDQDLN